MGCRMGDGYNPVRFVTEKVGFFHEKENVGAESGVRQGGPRFQRTECYVMISL